MSSASADPINRVIWRQAAELNANDYNPNVVFSPELRLLEHSLLATGWVQPILITPDDRIIDGFHRVQLAIVRPQVRERWGGLVPTAVIECTRPQAMMLTIRMNRAKGTHVALRMSAIVRELVDVHGVSADELATGIGASRQEIELLHQEGVFAARKIPDHRYSKAWYPAETEECVTSPGTASS